MPQSESTGNTRSRRAPAPTLRQAGLVLAFAASLPACSVDDRAFTTPEQALGAEQGMGQAGASTDIAGPGAAGSSGSGGPEVVGQPPPRARPTKLDLLFMVDNSTSMGDKQDILRRVGRDLLSRLVNPICLDAAGNESPAPAPGADCPAGQRRQFEPLEDVHVGIVSSSLGDAGANQECPVAGFPKYAPDRVDMAHLMGSLARSTAASTAEGFLEWRAGATDLESFDLEFQRMLTDVG